VADNQGIKDYVRERYAKPAELIGYGGDQGLVVGGTDSAPDTRFASFDYFLAICRIEPENNIEIILDAFSRLRQRIVLVGNWDSSPYARRVRAKFGRYQNIELKSAVYDQARLASLRANALAYVHGHSAGGTNPSLVEAMSFGMAVIAFDVNYNRHTTNNKACYWATEHELSRLVSETTREQLRANGRAMKQLAEQEHTWNKVVAAYAKLFDRD
jgi:glycosyltransferase involved in cell wall biosynthesis